MRAKKYILSMAVVYMAYFTHGIQAIILSQNKLNFFTQWGYTDEIAGAAAVSLAITATGFGKFLTVWLGGEISDKIGRKKMAVAGGVLYIICFAGLLFSHSFTVACICAFLAGVATSGFWDASLYPAVQEAVKPAYAGSALIGIKAFVSVSGIIYPLLAVHFSASGNWKINVWIPLIFSVICVILAVIAPFAYDDDMKEKVKGQDGNTRTAAQAEIEAIKAGMLVKPNGLVNFITMFYGFLCMFIMYGAQQYTKAFGMTNCGLTELQAAGMTSIYTVGSIVAVVFWAIMMGKLRWNPLKVVLIDSVFTAIALAIVLLVKNVTVIYVAIALLGFFAAGGALQTGLGVRQKMCPGPKGRNTGIYYTWMGLASCFLPYIVSAMTKSIGETDAIYTMMGLLLAAAVVAVLMMAYLAVQYKKIFGESALAEKRNA
ncbi:MFS transporter [Clostridiaceae bacterium 68-1-5]|uniref:MFS transporter n=1 Tax=Suipraeoptans intestinalis TaxID=2606628 RepID=A0A6N7UQZ3_9FIRM|nr:MFS transporter [Suipraeoptans intestinalis]MSR93033.1 MFS transporter [Suipraeoptans intestinalis]